MLVFWSIHETTDVEICNVLQVHPVVLHIWPSLQDVEAVHSDIQLGSFDSTMIRINI